MVLLKHEKLWESIRDYPIDDPTSETPLSVRLAQENLGWTHEYALRVIDEYKKFIFLGCVVGPVTPSEEVDAAWHLHMIYTKDYEDFCRVLGRFFHHGPTKGGTQESEKYIQQYVETLQTYAAVFGYYPSTDIWPVTAHRFTNWDFKRASLRQNWIIPRGSIKRLLKAAWIELKVKFK